ncbi:MAG: 1-acyl-sn-glycerol-3-phosphate acyltransferase, partial [Gemmataceae bacterium]|nr:1-acyl-sn-glycerol-3-phosphate acyltransferase [Gemmataceae bacterium]
NCGTQALSTPLRAETGHISLSRDRPPFVARLWYNAVYWTMWIVFTLGYSFRRRGWHHLPRRGPVLIVANHQSMFDPILIGLAARRYLSFLARHTLFDQPLLGPVIRSLNAIPIDRSFGKEGIQLVLQALAAGQAVVMFPEGERTHTGTVQPLKPGVALLIRRVRCPIVPVGIAGAFAAWNRFQRWPRLAPLWGPPSEATLAVSVGPPLDPRQLEPLDRQQMLERLRAAIVQQVEQAERLRRH